MTTKETLTIRKNELLAEAEKNARNQVKKFVENELARLERNNFVVLHGHTTIECPIYFDPKYVSDELAAAGFEIKKSDKWTFIIEW